MLLLFYVQTIFFTAEISVLHLKLTKTTAQVWYQGSPFNESQFIHTCNLSYFYNLTFDQIKEKEKRND